jgi:hypothetical protein
MADSETKIKLEDMPAAVQAAIKKQGATARAYATELEHGKRLYEAEMTVNGHLKVSASTQPGK